MNMDQKNKMIEDYINNISNQVNSRYDGLIDNDKISRTLMMFKDSSEDLETEIIPKINELVQEVITNYLKAKEKEQKSRMLKNIEKNISSDFFIEMLKKDWEETHDIQLLGKLIGELYIHHIINKDGYGFKNYMTEIEKLYLQYNDKQISPQQFELQRAKLISMTIGMKMGIDLNKEISSEDMGRIKDHFLQEYVSDGFVSHSFHDAYYESIMKNGLISSTESREDKPLEVPEIQDIFMKKGVVAPMGGYPYYGGSGIYYEQDFTKMFWHAIDSPEWFKWFTSSDHLTTYHKNIETSPYILRSEKDCRRNIDDLCRNAELDDTDTKKVVDFYQKQYAKFMSPKLNVALISKKTVGKDNIQDAVPQNMDLLSTINYVLKDGAHQYSAHQGNVYNGVIPPTELNISVIPNASIYIKADHYSRETKEHLLNPDSNLAVLQNAEKNRNRLVPSMSSKVEKVKSEIMNKKKDKNGIQIQPQQIKKQESFAHRSQSEIQVSQQIKQKNNMIKQQKAQKQQLNKPRVRTLTKSSLNSSSTGSKGFTNVITLSLIVSFVCGALFIIVYMLIKRS